MRLPLTDTLEALGGGHPEDLEPLTAGRQVVMEVFWLSAEEERRRGRPLGTFYGLDSIALEQAMRRRPGCRGDLYKLYRFVHEGTGGFAAGMWFGSLRYKYPEEYRMMKAERDGEFYEQQEL